MHAIGKGLVRLPSASVTASLVVRPPQSRALGVRACYSVYACCVIFSADELSDEVTSNVAHAREYCSRPRMACGGGHWSSHPVVGLVVHGQSLVCTKNQDSRVCIAFMRRGRKAHGGPYSSTAPNVCGIPCAGGWKTTVHNFTPTAHPAATSPVAACSAGWALRTRRACGSARRCAAWGQQQPLTQVWQSGDARGGGGRRWAC